MNGIPVTPKSLLGSSTHVYARRTLFSPLPLLVALLTFAATTAALFAPLLAKTAAADPAASQDVNSLQHQMIVAAEQYAQANVKLQDSQHRLAVLKPQVEKQQALVAEKQRAVNQVAAVAYQQGGGVDQLTTLMVNSAPDTMLDQLSFLQLLNQERRDRVDELKGAETRLEKQQNSIKNEVDEQSKQQKALSDKQQEINEALVKYDQSQAGGSAGTTRLTYDGKGQGLAALALRYAYAQQGKPYVLGAAGPTTFDCSGLTMAAWAQAGISMSHSAEMQYVQLPHVSLDSIQPGDLVFYGHPIHHVAIYIGGGKVLHAPTPGAVVRTASIENAGSEPPMGAARPSLKKQ